MMMMMVWAISYPITIPVYWMVVNHTVKWRTIRWHLHIRKRCSWVPNTSHRSDLATKWVSFGRRSHHPAVTPFVVFYGTISRISIVDDDDDSCWNDDDDCFDSPERVAILRSNQCIAMPSRSVRRDEWRMTMMMIHCRCCCFCCRNASGKMKNGILRPHATKWQRSDCVSSSFSNDFARRVCCWNIVDL